MSRKSKGFNKRRRPRKPRLSVKELKPRILIICEGQTEKYYFEAFPVETAEVLAIDTGRSKQSLVDYVAIYLAEQGEKPEDFEQIWVVFDMDYDPRIKNIKRDFDNSIDSAQNKGYRVAYSNDAFELWFYLHYQYIDQPQHRSFYFAKLAEIWQLSSSKDEKTLIKAYEQKAKKADFASGIYELLQNDRSAGQANAIRRARTLHEAKKHLPYHRQNPVTTVYLLVEKLNELAGQKPYD